MDLEVEDIGLALTEQISEVEGQFTTIFRKSDSFLGSLDQ